MATEVETLEDLTLDDGTTVELHSLNIKNLRKFMRTWTNWTTELVANMEKDEEAEDRLDENTMNDKQFDVYIELSALCLKKPLEVAKVEFDKDEDLKDYLEENLTEQKLYHLLDKCGGLKLNDPNLQAAAGGTN